MNFANPAPPTDDRRWRLVDATMRRHGRKPHALIESLHTVQEAFGFLDRESLEYVAGILRVPLSKVFGVATFYHYFNLKPPGRHSCVVCLGTACYIKGSAQIVQSIAEREAIEPGETTPDGRFSLLTARCVGSCGLAPAVVFDGQTSGNLSSAQVLERIDEWSRDDT